MARIEIDLSENEHALWDYAAAVNGTWVSEGFNYTREGYAADAALNDALGRWFDGR